MSRWSPDRSKMLSILLDEVTGDQETIHIRNDHCLIKERVMSTTRTPMYYTGSRSEGLDLPGSDDDYMFDINESCYGIEVIQSLDEASNTSSNTVLYLRTDNVSPCFALLQMLKVHPIFDMGAEIINSVQYLRSNYLVQGPLYAFKSHLYGTLLKRQGPSMEQHICKGKEPIDNVYSIHCAFWPNDALEWRQRPRKFGWPTTSTISYIISFGFHLVPVGHPHSKTKLTEWRFSFSLAERALVS